MITLSSMTTGQLLERTFVLNNLKMFGPTELHTLSQKGIDNVNDELSAIEAELDSRQPEGEFQILYELPANWWIHHSIYCGTRTRACHTTTCPKYIYEDSGQWIGKVDIVGFEPIYGTDLELLPDDYGLQPQYL